MRTLGLAVAAVAVALLVMVLQAPDRKTGASAVHGARLVRLPRHAVRRVEVTLEGRHFLAHWRGTGWEVDGRPPSAAANIAVNDLVETLVTLRAVDQFRGEVQVSFGLTPPRGTVVIASDQREVRLSLGAFSSAVTTLYARRAGDPRVFQIGTYLLSQIARVLDR